MITIKFLTYEMASIRGKGQIRYKSCRPQDEHIRERLRALSGERKRFGDRRLHVLLAREGIQVNHKKIRRLYREERLTVRKRGGRKRALGTRAPIAVPSRVNERWSLGNTPIRVAIDQTTNQNCKKDTTDKW